MIAIKDTAENVKDIVKDLRDFCCAGPFAAVLLIPVMMFGGMAICVIKDVLG